MSSQPPSSAADALRQGGPHRLRILFVGAAPALEQEPLRLQREWELLHEEVMNSALPTSLVRLLPPSREALVSTLDRAAAAQLPAQVLHFAGHGDVEHLLFETSLGEPYRYERSVLAGDLRGRGVRLAIFNACTTASLSTLSLARDLVAFGALEAAIGHQRPIQDDAAHLFAAALYRSLCKDACLHDAFGDAERALAMTYRDAASQTQLFGNGAIRFGALGANGPGGPYAFDGTSGRGYMPAPPRFFGRSQELISIGRFLEASDAHVLAISGMGGIGKTSLVQESASRHAWRFPGGLAFASAQPQGLAPVTAEFLLHSVSAVLALPPAPRQEPAVRLFDHLRAQPSLLVFDQLDDLAPAELERLVQFLEGLPRNGSKAILTSRTSPALLGGRPWLRSNTLTTGLSPRAGTAYVMHAARDRVPELASPGSHGRPSQAPALRLSLAVAGHPRLLDLAVGIAATQGMQALEKAVPGLTRPEGMAGREPVAGLLEEQVETFLESALGLLDADGAWVLSFFPCSPDGTFTREELHAAARGAERAAGRSEPPVARVLAGLSTCVESGLLGHEPEADRFRIHSTVQGHVARRSAGHGAGVLQGLVEHCLAYVRAHLGHAAALERRLSFLMGIFERAWHEEVPGTLREDVLEAVNHLSPVLMVHGVLGAELSRWMERLEGRRGEPQAVRAEQLHQKSLLLFGQGRLAESKQCILEAIELRSGSGLRQDRISALKHLAILEEVQGNLQEVRRILEECRGLLLPGDRPGLTAGLLLQLGWLELRQGRVPEARALLLEALDRYRKGDDPEGLGGATVLMALGILESGQGNVAEGRKCLDETAAIFKARGAPLPDAGLLQLLASSSAARGQFMEARGLLSQALELQTNLGAPHLRAGLLLQLAHYHRQQGQYPQALGLLNQALGLYGEDFPRGRALVYSQLAAILLSQNDPEAAWAYQQLSLEQQEREGDHQGRAVSLLNLSMSLYRQGRYAEARPLAEQALELQRRLGDEPGRADSLHHLGVIDMKLGRYPQAEEHLRESLRLQEALGKHAGRGPSLTMLAQVEAQLGWHSEASQHIQEGIGLLERAGDPMLSMARTVLMNLTAPKELEGQPPSAWPEWVSGLMHAAEESLRSGQLEQGLREVRAATAAHAQQATPRELAAIHALEAQMLAFSGRPHEAREAIHRATATAEAAGLHGQARSIRQLQEHLERLFHR